MAEFSDLSYVDGWVTFGDNRPFLVDFNSDADGIKKTNFMNEFYSLIKVCTKHNMHKEVKP